MGIVLTDMDIWEDVQNFFFLLGQVDWVSACLFINDQLCIHREKVYSQLLVS